LQHAGAVFGEFCTEPEIKPLGLDPLGLELGAERLPGRAIGIME